jgi:hypothetical protein
MNTQQNQPGNEQQKGQSAEAGQDENIQVSVPKNDRPEGPFEHSGEVAGWTKEEQEEVSQEPEDQQGQQGQP